MNPLLFIPKKNELAVLIKKVSDAYGGDDIVWLREYAKEVIELNRENLDAALDCFNNLLKVAPKRR